MSKTKDSLGLIPEPARSTGAQIAEVAAAISEERVACAYQCSRGTYGELRFAGTRARACQGGGKGG